ncbi:MAG: AgmX/PglI C-terminal domain-containing protein [Myxococcales bacterium]|nr:AgmX/PglI C-terminal domain-containing protein [Myxococcales bacterium]
MTHSHARLLAVTLCLLPGLTACKRNNTQATSDKAATPPAVVPSASTPSSASASTVASAAPTAPDPSKIVADAARKDALKCFGDELKKDPKAGGTVTLKVGVAANGKVVKTEVVKSTSSKPLTDCVVDVVGKLSSLDFKQPTTLEVPFVFRD